MSEDEDDKPTVVLDINALKNELSNKKDSLDNIASEIEFAANDGLSDEVNSEATNNEKDPTKNKELSIYLFDFKSNFFSSNLSLFPSDFNYSVISDLAELNKAMKNKKEGVLFFNYNSAPGPINQLLSQIKVKFTHIKTVLMAKSLSEDKVLKHKASKSGANFYLNIPLETAKIEDILNQLIST